MTENFDPVAHNRASWDREVDQGNEWTRPVGPDVIARARAGDWSVVLIGYEYSHTLTEQIGGQLAVGFTLTHLVEAPHHADATARYMPGYIATRAIKPPRA
jgi:hypothetical protein